MTSNKRIIFHNLKEILSCILHVLPKNMKRELWMRQYLNVMTFDHKKLEVKMNIKYEFKNIV